MPGLIGLVKNNSNCQINFNTAFDELSYGYNNIKDNLYVDEYIFAQRVHLGIIGEKSSPFTKDNVKIWIEGEIYNQKFIEQKTNRKFSSFSEILFCNYKKGNLADILSLVDGYFCAAIYDKKERKVYLISDRYGFKPLYYSSKNFAWSSELKSFRHLAQSLSLNFDAIKTFLNLGHFIGNTTYFKDIHLLDASTILEYNIETKHTHKIRYWSWSNIAQQNISLEESTDLLYHYLKKAVESRVGMDINEKTGITLSGGIDSRVLLSFTDIKIPALTFGTKNCRDYLLAQKVARKKKTKHKLLELNDYNWFEGKLDAIWNTDGMFNLMHMHSSPFMKDFPKEFSINLNGFSGDLNVGGGWITNPNSKITEEVAIDKFANGYKLTNISDSFYNVPHEDPFFIDNRVRRFTNMGTIQNAKYLEQRKPFFENELVQFTYSIPDEYRLDGLVYKKMISKHLKDLFWSIPTTHSIYPVNRENSSFLHLKNKLIHGLMRTKLLPQYNWKYTNYEKWYYQPSFQKLIKDLFKDSIISDYCSQLNINLLEFDTKNLNAAQVEKRLMFITLEIWFKQFYTNTYLTENDK